jgi:transposase
MPLRPPPSRERTWLLPPTLEELIPGDHPARFAAAFIDGLDRQTWAELGVAVDGEALGAPAYHPQVLLAVWVYGFMGGVRSSRKLEGACRDQVPYLWLTGWQHPDHNTLWRFYKAHRAGMRALLKRTVRTAVRLRLVDLAVQAVDGTKVAASAAKDRTYDAAGLERLLARTDAAIADLEAQNETGGDAPPPRLPEALAHKQALGEQVREAMERVSAEDGPKRTNLTDADVVLLKGRTGIVVGYNAQAVVSPLQQETAGRTGLLITAADVVTAADDRAQLLPMCEAAEEMTGQRAAVTLADCGYHSGPNLAACAEREQTIAMPDSRAGALSNPYHKNAFTYDADADHYTCPQGQTLGFRGVTRRKNEPEVRVYRAATAVCRACPAFGQCTKGRTEGRRLEIGPEEAHLRRHLRWMATQVAQAAYRQRKQIVEPSFGILKEQQGARRFLLRGLENVRAEWTLLATAFNLQTLARVWRQWAAGPRGLIAAGAMS